MQVLAVTADREYAFLSLVSEEGATLRGWFATDGLEIIGFAPTWPEMEETVTLAAPATEAFVLPEAHAAMLSVQIEGGVPLRHVERDAQGNEWVYVETAVQKKLAWVYLPASSLAGWQARTDERFRIAGNTPQLIYEKTLTSTGYSELMWATAPAQGQPGVVVSGRTDVKRGPIDTANGKRDAWILHLDEQGEVVQKMSTGGSEIDSFHCVQPYGTGYAVSGITRSTNKQFAGIWDAASCRSGAGGKLSSSNALIGVLDGEFKVKWLKSMGVPKGSYGYDMVLPAADGTLVGVGWSTAGSGSVLYDYGKQDFYLARFGPDGAVLGQSSYGTPTNDVPDSGILTADGGVLMVGKTYAGDTSNGYIVKFGADLQPQWTHQYGGPGDEWFDNIRELPDGTYLLSGYTDSASGAGLSRGSADFWAVRMDALGRVIWSLHYGGSGYEEVRGTTVLADGSIVLVGQTNSTDGDVRGYRRGQKGSDGWALCIDEQGQIIWSLCLGGTGKDYFNAAYQDASDGTLVLVGAKDNASDTQAKAWVVKLQLP